MDEYSQRLNRDRRIHAENNQRFTTLRCYCHLIDQINLFSQTLGKDGKFQLFICLAARYISYNFNSLNICWAYYCKFNYYFLLPENSFFIQCFGQ